MKSDYDFLAWMKSSKSEPLKNYKLKKPIQYYFVLTEMQQRERYDQFRRYGIDINALSKIVVRIKPDNWLRSVGTNPNFIKDKMETKLKSITRYSISN